MRCIQKHQGAFRYISLHFAAVRWGKASAERAAMDISADGHTMTYVDVVNIRVQRAEGNLPRAVGNDWRAAAPQRNARLATVQKVLERIT